MTTIRPSLSLVIINHKLVVTHCIVIILTMEYFNDKTVGTWDWDHDRGWIGFMKPVGPKILLGVFGVL
jgi:hypothetical protein